MFRRNHNAKIIKQKQTYSTEEICNLLKIHAQTVGTWYKSSLKRIDNKQPYLVFGQDLIDFIKVKNNKRKRKSEANEMFCFKCQKPRKSKDNIACIKIYDCKVNLIGNCEICNTKINKVISPQKIDEYKKIFRIQVIHDKNLLECGNTCTNTNTTTNPN